MRDFEIGDRVVLRANLYWVMAQGVDIQDFNPGTRGTVEFIKDYTEGSVYGVRLDEPSEAHPTDGYWAFFAQEIAHV